LDQGASDAGIKLLLEDMERREQKFHRCIAQYESEEGPGVMNSWLQFVPEEGLHVEHLSERLAEPHSLSELVEETHCLNSSLSDAYLALAKQAPTSDLENLFSNLVNLEECNDSHYVEALLDG
jgi:hypothetical protein